jgi:hypothetical protein
MMSGAPWLERLPDDSEKQREGGTGLVGRWVEASKRVLRITAVAMAALALGFWGRPSGQVVLGLSLAVLVTLAIIEFPARPAPRSDAVSTPT